MNNSNTTNTVNVNANARSQANGNGAMPTPSPGKTENNAQVKGNANENDSAAPKNQNKIPSYGELGKDAPPAKFTAPFGIVATVLSLLLIVWLLTTVDYKKEGLVMLIMAAIGLVIYFAYRFLGKRNSESPSEN